MSPLLMTLISSLVMLIFMAFPAMKIVEWWASKKVLSQQVQNILTVILTIILSIMVGIFLNYEALLG
jgi:glucan phosphoethanolaminetransferase (alkaline phosphatase superfamily)